MEVLRPDNILVNFSQRKCSFPSELSKPRSRPIISLSLAFLLNFPHHLFAKAEVSSVSITHLQYPHHRPFTLYTAKL